MYFETLVDFLKENGFQVVVTLEPGNKFPYQFAKVTGQGIEGGFCEPNDTSYKWINGRFAADHIDCFDKWSKCPVQVEFPFDENQGKELLEMLKHLGTSEGFEYSNEYEYLNNNRYKYN